MVAQNTKPPSDNLYLIDNALSVAIGFLGAVIARGSFPPGPKMKELSSFCYRKTQSRVTIGRSNVALAADSPVTGFLGELPGRAAEANELDGLILPRVFKWTLLITLSSFAMD